MHAIEHSLDNSTAYRRFAHVFKRENKQVGDKKSRREVWVEVLTDAAKWDLAQLLVLRMLWEVAASILC